MVFIRPGEDGYDDSISSELTRCAEYMDKVLNHDRAEYLSVHEHELNNYPTMAGKSAEELKAELLDAMSKGQEVCDVVFMMRPSCGVLPLISIRAT